jgi:hypothetical protein
VLLGVGDELAMALVGQQGQGRDVGEHDDDVRPEAPAPASDDHAVTARRTALPDTRPG